MIFKVTRQYRGHEQELIARFTHLGDARTFVQGKIENDERMNTIATDYRIFKDDKLVETQRWNKQATSKGSTKGFHPTPAPTTLRPPGGPPPLRDEDEEEE